MSTSGSIVVVTIVHGTPLVPIIIRGERCRQYRRPMSSEEFLRRFFPKVVVV